MNVKDILHAAIGALIALIAYDLVVRKMLKLDSYDEYESYEE